MMMQMKKQAVSIGLVGLLATSSLSLTGCTDEQLALGAGVLLGAAVASSVSKDDNHHHRHDRRKHYEPRRDSSRYDRRPGHRYDHRDSRRWHGSSLNLSEDTVNNDETLAASEHYGVSPDTAARIVTALQAAEGGDFSALQELGLEKTDLIALGIGENPSVSALNTLSEKLGLDLAETHKVIQQMKIDLAKAN